MRVHMKAACNLHARQASVLDSVPGPHTGPGDRSTGGLRPELKSSREGFGVCRRVAIDASALVL